MYYQHETRAYVGRIASHLGDTITVWQISDRDGDLIGTEIVMEVRECRPTLHNGIE